MTLFESWNKFCFVRPTLVCSSQIKAKQILFVSSHSESNFLAIADVVLTDRLIIHIKINKLKVTSPTTFKYYRQGWKEKW